MKQNLQIKDWIVIVEAAIPDLRPDLLPLAQRDLARLKELPPNAYLMKHGEECLLILYGNGTQKHYLDAFSEDDICRSRPLLVPLPEPVSTGGYLAPFGKPTSVSEVFLAIACVAMTAAFILAVYGLI